MALAIGVSLKMYFGHARTLEWVDAVAALARRHPAVRDGIVRLFVVPTFPALVPVLERVAGTGIEVGAQDVAWADEGAYTGEVSAVELAEIGVRLAEIGHAERRRLFGETEQVVADKTAAALRNGIVPLLCIGEAERMPVADAARECIGQLDAAIDGSPGGELLVAYEPHWAIGAERPAEPEHIRTVLTALREHLAATPGFAGGAIYGGSAGPGLLTELAGATDGLFLGRFAHDPAALEAILDEALRIRGAAA
ncbi:triosephosphate isomerase [Diaminobutyricimonas aerilata]|uniref:Triosephosphate isomerase n=1 Tax=Diaminobutyricimonas aerilata TaxID=1162967 RepID=A0A2M9CI20_9MICO|nr:triose-phosphate isomerase family protein [Diaminobutyricimonas aerilata]PJJ71522.1 triosephosphate isomerase [Diaminobutyricimonas aerilata]